MGGLCWLYWPPGWVLRRVSRTDSGVAGQCETRRETRSASVFLAAAFLSRSGVSLSIGSFPHVRARGASSPEAVMVQRMFLRARNVLTIAALMAGAWMCATPAVAQQSSVRAGPTEWFRDDPNTANGGGGAAPGVPAAPGDVPPAPPANVAPPAGNGNAPMVPNVRPYRMPPISGYGGNGYGSVSGLYPSAEMNSYATAMARAATARALFHQADSELGQAYRA